MNLLDRISKALTNVENKLAQIQSGNYEGNVRIDEAKCLKVLESIERRYEAELKRQRI